MEGKSSRQETVDRADIRPRRAVWRRCWREGICCPFWLKTDRTLSDMGDGRRGDGVGGEYDGVEIEGVSTKGSLEEEATGEDILQRGGIRRLFIGRGEDRDVSGLSLRGR